MTPETRRAAWQGGPDRKLEILDEINDALVAWQAQRLAHQFALSLASAGVVATLAFARADR